MSSAGSIETMGQASSLLQQYMFRGLDGLSKMQREGVSSATFLRVSSMFVERYAHVQSQLLLQQYKSALIQMEQFLLDNKM